MSAENHSAGIDAAAVGRDECRASSPVVHRRPHRVALTRLLLATAAVLVLSGHGEIIAQQVLDICGCAGDPTLRPFHSNDPSTYPEGTTCSGPCNGGTLILGLPEDGVLRFSSFTVDGTSTIGFRRNAANTPVTILVAGDVIINAPGCCQVFTVGGDGGSNGTSTTAGVGGLGGNGGFRGGDGAAQPINLQNTGGAGFGPGGGNSGIGVGIAPGGGTFFGLPELLPVVGASGGGGGGSVSCSAGGGGGGGGGLLIAANGRIHIRNYVLSAAGGAGGHSQNFGVNCARGGGGGSGGSIRLVAHRLENGGSGFVRATAGTAGVGGNSGTAGRVRLESVDASAQTQLNTDEPPALRVTGPGPISNPLSPTVRITHVSGNAIAAAPTGYTGAIDVVLPAPGITPVDVTTTGVPSGTTVQVTAKPRIGATPFVTTVPLSDCDTLGNCDATATFNLPAGAYVIEARATFQVD